MYWQIFFTRFQFTGDILDALNQDYNKSYDLYWLRDFSVISKIWLLFIYF